MSYQVIKTKSKGSFKVYSEAFKKMLEVEIERGPLNKDQLQAKYGIGGNTRIFEWCKKYGKSALSRQGEDRRSNERPFKSNASKTLKRNWQMLS